MVSDEKKMVGISKYDDKFKYIPVLLLAVYFFLNLAFLVEFPFVHSDESWLSGFSRTVIAEKTFRTSEPFFDLYPRAIHGLRVVFVSLQIGMIKLFGYSIFSVRLMSLVFSTVTLSFVYRLIVKWSKDRVIAGLVTLIIGSNIQFIMSAHTARQEAPILFFMVLAFYVAVANQYKYDYLISAMIIGISIGIHPNSFIIGCGIGLILLYRCLKKDLKLRELMVYIGVLAIWATIFVGLSILINPNFIKDYLAFGSQLGIGGPNLGRFESFYYFYYKLFFRIGGTYKLVPIKVDLILMVAVIPLFLMTKHIIKNEDEHKNIMSTTLMVVGINIAYVIIGRYNQTSILFTIVFSQIAFTMALVFFTRKLWDSKLLIYGLLGLLLLFQIVNSYSVIVNDQSASYKSLGETLKQSIPREAKVLANLNVDYHFELYQLYDYRNLMMLEENKMSFTTYIKKNEIDYIVLFEEMEYIYKTDGKWDVLYGSLDYYEEMTRFIEEECDLVHEFENETYGIRIARYVNSQYPWAIKIYKIK